MNAVTLLKIRFNLIETQFLMIDVVFPALIKTALSFTTTLSHVQNYSLLGQCFPTFYGW